MDFRVIGQEHWRILWHSLGLSRHRRIYEPYRNYYVAGPGHHSAGLLADLGAAGLMASRPGGSLLPSSSVVYVVTDEGRELAMDTFRSSLPKLTRGQKRYQRWLDYSDCGHMSFGEWLKAGCP